MFSLQKNIRLPETPVSCSLIAKKNDAGAFSLRSYFIYSSNKHSGHTESAEVSADP